MGKGHTPKIGYFAPGSGATLLDLTREDYLGWVMHTAQRLHYLGRVPVDEQGIRNPGGRQATWMGMMEADLFYQSAVMPPSITGLSTTEYESLKQGLKNIKEVRRDDLLQLRALARKSYVNANRSVQEKEVDDLTNWIDRILDPSHGYSEAHTWTRGTNKAPPLPTHLVEGEGDNQVVYGHPHEFGAKYVRYWGNLWTQQEYAPWGHVAQMIRNISWDAGSMTQLTVEDIRRAIFSLRPGTAVGADQWRPDELRLLTPEGLEMMVKLYREVESKGVWPTGLLANIVVLMGKPKGGSRPIALICQCCIGYGVEPGEDT